MANTGLIKNAAKLSGFLILFIAVSHLTIGTAEIMNSIKVGDIRPALIATIKSVWIVAGFLFLISACWIFFISGQLKLLNKHAWWQGIFISIFYIILGIACTFFISFQLQFAGFIIAGFLLLLPLIRWAGAFQKREYK